MDATVQMYVMPVRMSLDITAQKEEQQEKKDQQLSLNLGPTPLSQCPAT